MYSKYTNIFYKKNERSFKYCDCYGICYLFNKEELGVELPLFLNEPIKDNNEINATFNKNKNKFKKVSKGKEKIGDIVSLLIKGHSVHVGVVLQRGLMLHIIDEQYAKIESYNTINWNRRVDSFWRYENNL